MEKFTAAGIMSGTSLDGLDVAICEFIDDNNHWHFDILEAETLTYSEFWRNRLLHAHKLKGLELLKLHAAYGHFIGQSVKDFLKKKKIRIDLIASHGHTIFHDPAENITFQLGSGATISAVTGIKTISDFRTMDVALGGQGAPLVPVGDHLLFGEYDFCLNLGGFANISYDRNGKRIAFDICPVNIVLNHLANRFHKRYDKNGELGRLGIINNKLLDALDNLSYYQRIPPKSLSREWLERNIYPLFENCGLKDEDIIATFYEHAAHHISMEAKKPEHKNGMITGGGAYNQFLVDKLRDKCRIQLTLPQKEIIEYKEALIFAFLGILRNKNLINCWSSATGAARDNKGGIIHESY